MRPETAQRLHQAFIAAIATLLVQALSYKLGFRGKYVQWDSSTSWQELAAAAPNFVILSIAIAGLVYFWPRQQ